MSSQNIVVGKIHSFVVKTGRQKRHECFDHEQVKAVSKAYGGGIYFTRFELPDGSFQEQIGYSERDNPGDPAWRYRCPGDGGHDHWVTTLPTEKMLTADSCPICEF